jgi:hypothetical protein
MPCVSNGALLGLYCLGLDLLGTPLCEFNQIQMFVTVQKANSNYR